MIFQFVCFDTSLARMPFLSRWSPFASAFLSRGIGRIVLSERTALGGFGFVSRNVWPEECIMATFQGVLPPDVGGGAVRAIQGGAFRLVAGAHVDPLMAREGAPKLVALLVGSRAVEQAKALTGRLTPESAWALYARAPDFRGGRFDAVLELFGDHQPALTALGAQPMQEVLALPSN